MNQFKSIIQFYQHFDTEQKCREYLEQQRWGGKPICPYCEHEKVYRFKDKKTLKCAKCRKRFTVTVGTIYENTKLPLVKWFLAMYLCTNHKKGISSCQLARDLNVCQKTAWFVLHRVREMIKDKQPTLLEGVVEADETFVGGKEGNRKRQGWRLHSKKNRPSKKKTPVLGILQRDGKLILKVVKDTKERSLVPHLLENVSLGSKLFTDENRSYSRLELFYEHDMVEHSWYEYVRGDVHTNSIEGFWGELKRGVNGIYHHVSPKHLSGYCDEYAFRFNSRHVSQDVRFAFALKNSSGSRLKYNDLVKRKGSRY